MSEEKTIKCDVCEKIIEGHNYHNINLKGKYQLIKIDICNECSKKIETFELNNLRERIGVKI